jgi:hypothetical protein
MLLGYDRFWLVGRLSADPRQLRQPLHLKAWLITCLCLVLVLSFNYSRYSEGIDLSLLQREEVVPYQISNGPYDDNYEER